MKRIRIEFDRPNQLFETWLEEWRSEAVRRNSELSHHFAKALDSLKKYPLPLASGKECMVLQHFGAKLCSMLDRRLKDYRTERSETHSSQACQAFSGDVEDCCDAESRKKEPARRDKLVDTREATLEAKQVRNAQRTVSKRLPNANDVPSKNTDRQIYLEPGSFDVILLVDTQETCGGKTKPQHDATLKELTQLGVLFEVRRLKIGDFTWIAKCKRTNDELVLPYIVERKRMDDLSASIIDGRFHEQKFRLKQSGIENLMYIVESIDKNSRFSIPLPSLLQASINCLVQDGFTVKYTRNHKDSMSYLSCVTKILIKIYKDKSLIGCKREHLTQTNNSDSTTSLMEFKEFNKACSKQRVRIRSLFQIISVQTFKVSEMFIRQLLQLKGMSIDKATAVVERYPTPQILITALHNADKDREQLLAGIQVGDKKRQLGPAISRTICQLYTIKDLN